MEYLAGTHLSVSRIHPYRSNIIGGPIAKGDLSLLVSQLTPRGLACLVWIAQQYAIRLDQLQRLLYRHTPEQDRYKLKADSDSVSLDRTYELIKKWLSLGLIEKRTILHGDKAWIWLSRQGLRTAGLSFHYGDGAPASVRLPHLYSINQVRLAIEAKLETFPSEMKKPFVLYDLKEYSHDYGIS